MANEICVNCMYIMSDMSREECFFCSCRQSERYCDNVAWNAEVCDSFKAEKGVKE